ncbi:MAG: D-tyrosyl-tRNA(Tyr) deacylase [Flavobacteriales bacterium]|nr:D-tyrosyl-tRNA(Tyr) deacylase [Flavobacteriales bacterium]
MRAVVQRVSRAEVRVEGRVTGQIGHGVLILLGVEDADTADDARWLCGKIARMRIFADDGDVMNISLCESGGDALVVSQFTLHASTKKGNRPSYIRSARPEHAEPLYVTFKQLLAAELGRPVASGIFGAMMEVELVNDGPVTIVLDTRARE